MRCYVNRKITLVAILGISLGLSLSSCLETKTPKPKPVEISFKKDGKLSIHKSETDSLLQQIDIEIADTPYKRETGLMYRDQLGDQQGMLFIFDEAQYLAFYMKNTKISLDILYLNEEKIVVDIYENTTVMDETALPSKNIAKYVLEVNAGKVKEWGIEPGDYIRF
ncbi:DUF192 domain-containing protein [Paucihalobacter ruber]|uniref:DUF192 domain-containing protein n=1 Tax=Paucihalobacter ruber TaxID=2567861 RepID=A0A506PLV3_9FLAO|nr:DUF192 domain-containing protein [Paucihalobacter ruber]TPV34107.1 DUF192 domain-containing protein [Paucihalobacter ruber]